jgi:hypothetical protein
MQITIGPELFQWNPRQGLMDHAGQPLPPEMAFFASPPPEIGEIITAYSSMSIGKQISQRNPGYKRKATLLIATIAFLAFGFLAVADLFGAAVLAAIATLVIGPIIAMKIGYIVHSCTFVGTKGFSINQWDRRNQSRKPPETFLFEKAATLNTSTLHAYYGPIYHSSIYTVIWKNADGKRAWSTVIHYRKVRGLPPLRSLYYFYQSAENAWNHYQADSV